MNNVLPFNQANFNNNDIILLDTSFLLNSIGHNNNVAIEAECNNLISSIANAGAICCIPQIAKTEFSHIIRKDYFFTKGYCLEADIKKLKISDLALYQKIYDDAFNLTDYYFNLLNSIDLVYPGDVGVINNNLQKLARKIGSDFKIYGDNDSILLATAVNENINYLATTDKDFSYVNIQNLTILLDSSNYLKFYNPNSVQAQIDYTKFK